MAFLIACPNCGRRPFTEYWFGGEIPLSGAALAGMAGPEAEFARIWLRENAAGEQDEKWFHYAGCRRWLMVRRDTRTNIIHWVKAESSVGICDEDK